MDARFEEVGPQDRPLRLRAEGTEDLAVISSLVQDAIAKVSDISWAKGRRRLVLLLNRFRWEDKEAAATEGRPPERVRAMLMIDGVEGVRARGVSPDDPETVIALLSLGFEASGDPEDPAGTLTLSLAGDGDFALKVEMLDVTLEDLTRPWLAASGKAPSHDV